MPPTFDRVCVLGLGYVGLPTAAIFASRGLSVVGVDVNADTVRLINEGKVHIVEPDLDILVTGAVAIGKLRAAPKPERADAFIVAVPTPLGPGHRPDLGHVEAAAESLAPVLERGNLVVIESTSPVGTTEQVCRRLAARRPDLVFPDGAAAAPDVHVAYSPERVLPGRVLVELVRNDRVVGGISRACAERAAELYRAFVEGEIVLTTARTAELVKLAENSYRDVNIAFANELAQVCDRMGIDAWEVIALANRHPRVAILRPGPGVGGHCIAVDPWFVADSAPEDTPLIRAARAVNDGRPAHVAARGLALAAGRATPRIACLGLAYKADIDDLRESPAVEIVRLLAAGDAGEILVVEPYVANLPPVLANLARVRKTDLDTALAAADIVVLLVDHRPFRSLATERLEGKAVVDTRGLWR